MEFLLEYGLFLAKVVTFLIAFVIFLSIIAANKQASRQQDIQTGNIVVKDINQQYQEFEETLAEYVLSSKEQKQLQQEKKQQQKADKKRENSKPRLFLLEFDGDVEASHVDAFRHEVSAILMLAKPEDEVLVQVHSMGGMVHTYGLAASQLQRFRDANIPLTVSIDKVAASGGYLMACVANKIIAAPFAIVGSIGVLAQIPNFNRALRRFDVDYEVMTAGEFKAPVTMFGEITDKGRDKLQEELESTHELFKGFIEQHRPELDVASVATGETWYGNQALGLGLVDSLMTSDDYLLMQSKEKNIFQVSFLAKKSFQEKLGFSLKAAAISLFSAFRQQDRQANIS